MGRRGKQVWRSYRPSTATVACTWSGAYILAPTPDIASIVDMCATVEFVNGRAGGTVLKAAAFTTMKVRGHWRVKAYVVFRAERDALVPEMRNASFYAAPYSNYTLEIVDVAPTNVETWLDCWTHSVLTPEEALKQAIKLAGVCIGEAIAFQSKSFKDAVASRLRSFERLEAGKAEYSDSELSETESTNDSEPEQEGWRPPLPPRPAPFEKPASTALNDLLYAFATHAKDRATGKAIQVPLLHQPMPKHMYHPLVFASVTHFDMSRCNA